MINLFNAAEKAKELKNELKPYENPFHKDCVRSVRINFSKDIWNQEHWQATGYIEFVNKNTKGEQKFTAATIEDLLPLMAEFIKNL
jgi:hypothetical protein